MTWLNVDLSLLKKTNSFFDSRLRTIFTLDDNAGNDLLLKSIHEFVLTSEVKAYQNQSSLIMSDQVPTLLNKFNHVFQVDQVWSCLVKFGQVWSCLVMFHQVWSSLVMFDQVQSSSIMLVHVQSSATMFDQVWLCSIKFE